MPHQVTYNEYVRHDIVLESNAGGRLAYKELELTFTASDTIWSSSNAGGHLKSDLIRSPTTL
eukprot:scaffold15363_cov78-Skeletonema_marinoi.AAC.1